MANHHPQTPLPSPCSLNTIKEKRCPTGRDSALHCLPSAFLPPSAGLTMASTRMRLL
ncbi:hypothetical protein RMSM_04274 [Rhodopirellula maiorica SM1]|uniref:Uncharacterized protein n=1 Tax=Rhodopirellula maiorica SM1 TaxID=1265738 RepID=M5RY13_9BACT|nr:hypothetical protein RMSM_04274 [Rhodopirellula maiorica SM1]